MKERPILFQGAMVRALLAGTKTQTRRAVKPQPAPCDHKPWPGEYQPNWVSDADGWHCAQCGNGHRLDHRSKSGVSGFRCPYGQPGDRLWVRETWGVGTRPCPHEGWYDGIEYRADEVYLEDGEYLHLHRVNVPEGKDLDDYRGGWKPSIHMPRWACRLTLEITAVRVERLQDISEADAVAEGGERRDEFPHCPWWHGRSGKAGPCMYVTARDSYRYLWDAINGTGSWDANPWVWVVEFRRAQP